MSPSGSGPAHSVDESTSAGQQVVYADRVIIIGSNGGSLTTAVVWLNSGTAP